VFFQPGRGRKNEKSAGRYFREEKKKPTAAREGGATGQNPRKKNQTLPGNPLPSRLSWFLVSFFFCAGPVKKNPKQKKLPLEKVGLGFGRGGLKLG